MSVYLAWQEATVAPGGKAPQVLFRSRAAQFLQAHDPRQTPGLPITLRDAQIDRNSHIDRGEVGLMLSKATLAAIDVSDLRTPTIVQGSALSLAISANCHVRLSSLTPFWSRQLTVLALTCVKHTRTLRSQDIAGSSQSRTIRDDCMSSTVTLGGVETAADTIQSILRLEHALK